MKKAGKIYKRTDGRWCGNYYSLERDKRCYVYGKTQKEVKAKIAALNKRERGEKEAEELQIPVYKKKDGRWCTTYKEASTGKRRYIYGKTREEVVEKLKECSEFSKKDIVDAKPIPLNKQIFKVEEKQEEKQSDWLQEWILAYLMNFKKNELKVNTFDTYYGSYRKHIKDSEIGKIAIEDLTTMDLQAFYNRKSQDGYHSRTIRHMSVIINEALDYAVRIQKLKFNPNKYTILPKKKRYEAKVMTKEEVSRILMQAKEDELYPIVVTCIFTGMRKGEIMGLTWDNVDFENKMIYVRGSLCRVELEPDENGRRNTTFKVMEPKTAKSVRNIPMLEQTYAALKMQKQQQELEKIKYKDIYVDNGFVFARYDGNYMDLRGFRDRYHRFLERYGIEKMRFHDLRHTFASLLIEEGTSPKIVQELLGHSTITTTMDIYTHISEKSKAEAMEKISLDF